MRPAFDLSLYLVLDPDLCEPLGMVETTRLAVAGGATMVQLRDKKASTATMIETGRALEQVLSGSGVPLIINDDVEAAMACGADGVHVGQEDLPVPDVRSLVGPEMIIGLSTHLPEQAREARKLGADYIGVGPIFATNTKEDVVDPVGYDYLDWVTRNGDLPFVAIGGIKRHNIAEVARHGARCCSLVSELVGASDIRTRVEDVRKAMREGMVG